MYVQIQLLWPGPPAPMSNYFYTSLQVILQTYKLIQPHNIHSRGTVCIISISHRGQWNKTLVNGTTVLFFITHHFTSHVHCVSKKNVTLFTVHRHSCKLCQRCICEAASVPPSVFPSHAGIVSRRMKLRSCGFHRQVE